MVRPLETDQLAAKAHRERGEWARKEEQNEYQEKNNDKTNKENKINRIIILELRSVHKIF